MIRPTTIPQELRDLQIEQAVAREALRLAFEHHRSLAREMVGVARQRDVGELFEQQAGGQTLVSLHNLDLIIGSGGVLSHAPERWQAALMLLDAFAPEGKTTLAVDSIFMMPQLGVISTLHPRAATEVFDRDCLVRLGDVIAPVGAARDGDPCLSVRVNNGPPLHVPFGALRVLPLGVGETVTIEVRPASKHFDLGAGRNKPATFTVEGGVVGLILDTRGRPLALPSDERARAAKLREWMAALATPVE